MSIRSLGTLARRRRGEPTAPEAAAGPGDGALTALESAIPTEVITLYTAIIAACESVLAEDASDTYTLFRVAVYLMGLACTAYAAVRVVRNNTADSIGKALRSAEAQTAIVAFAAWGLVLPGSFLYVWLSPSLLSLTVATTTATATFLLAVVFAPRLRRREQPPTGTSPPLTKTPPTGP
jgi:hypothetical protein